MERLFWPKSTYSCLIIHNICDSNSAEMASQIYAIKRPLNNKLVVRWNHCTIATESFPLLASAMAGWPSLDVFVYDNQMKMSCRRAASGLLWPCLQSLGTLPSKTSRVYPILLPWEGVHTPILTPLTYSLMHFTRWSLRQCSRSRGRHGRIIILRWPTMLFSLDAAKFRSACIDRC